MGFVIDASLTIGIFQMNTHIENKIFKNPGNFIAA